MAKDYLPASKARQLFEDIAQIKKSLAVSNMITEKEAAELLGIKVDSLKRKVYAKEISEDAYTIGECNRRFYRRDKLMDLNKAL